MTDTVSTETTDSVSNPVEDTNDWKSMAQNAQSRADRYTSLVNRFGDNPEQALEKVQIFADNLDADFEGTVDVLRDQRGIKKPEPTSASTGVDGKNPFDFDKPGTESAQWLDKKIEARANEIVKNSLAQEKQAVEVDKMQGVLAQKGITNIDEQKSWIRKFYNPNRDFGLFVDSEMSRNKGRKPTSIDQVEHSNRNPKSAGLLQTEGEAVITDDEQVKKAVRDARGARAKAFK